MKILFYYDLPQVGSTLLTYTLAQELILRGHTVHMRKPTKQQAAPQNYDWVHCSGIHSTDAVDLARLIGARVHIHLEGVAYWRVGRDSALEWGFGREITEPEIEKSKQAYREWMSAAYQADSCSVNGQRQIETIQDCLFDGNPLPNCHRLSCGVDARYALSLPAVEKQDYIVTASRIAPNKKTMYIARALALIPKADRIPWLIVGYGYDAEVRHVIEFCMERQVELNIIPCYGAEKWMHIKRARLMVQGWNGIPPAEGLVCDVPVVSFDHDDIREQYEDGLHWAKDNNIQDMADVILNTSSRGGAVTTVRGKHGLLGGDLYACTQEQSAEQYEKIFEGGKP